MDLALLRMLKEYVELIDAMRFGVYAGSPHQGDAERLVLHEQLMQQTGLDRSTDMYVFAQDQMRLAHLAGYVRDIDY